LLGLAAVLLGTFISTLNTRISSFGLADIRGAVHAGFDDGAWITTAQTVAQMMIAPVAVWVGAVYGPRRVLLFAALAFAAISTVEPFSPNLPTLLVFQFAGGLATGCFVPLTLSFILRTTTPRFWAYGIALYALNLELSLNISASLEGYYVDHKTWRWIFWQNVPLALAMAACLHYGVARTPPGPQRPPPDLFGFASGGLGLGLIYAGLDQGNRLDWLNSGLIWALLLSGGVLFAGFLVHETRTPHPGVDLKVVGYSPLPQQLVLISFLRLTLLSTSFLVPQFLGAVRGYRGLEVGGTLLWVALPQLVICPVAGLLLRRVDPRMVACAGFILISLACLQVAHGLTPLWGTDQFLPSQLILALGQSFALTGVIFYGILHIRPENALTFGATLQTARLMGGEIGSAFIATLNRVRAQIASNHIGLHVQTGDFLVTQRLKALATVNAGDPAHAPARALGMLAGEVRTAAATQAVIDCFVVVAALTALALLLLVAQKSPPLGPGSPSPLRGPGASGP
jgi:DHA2 family multidrug resistance protein